MADRRPCPKCREAGGDTKGDNLAVYSDHSYCYACGYYLSHEENLERMAKRVLDANDIVDPDDPMLPADAVASFPIVEMTWLIDNRIDEEQVAEHEILYSQSLGRVIFPIHIGELLIGWQGRKVAPKKGEPKWFTAGNFKNTIVIFGKEAFDKGHGSNQIVLVEDVVSAIRVGRHCRCAPMFGSSPSNKYLEGISMMHDFAILWFDGDAQLRALDASQRLQTLSVTTSMLWTEKDPKAYSDDEIKELLATSFPNNHVKPAEVSYGRYPL